MVVALFVMGAYALLKLTQNFDDSLIHGMRMHIFKFWHSICCNILPQYNLLHQYPIHVSFIERIWSGPLTLL